MHKRPIVKLRQMANRARSAAFVGSRKSVKKLKQSFQNKTDRPQFITLELSTFRYRLNPGEELVLLYDADKVQDGLGAALRIEIYTDGDQIELIVWTQEVQMFFADGLPAPQDHNHT